MYRLVHVPIYRLRTGRAKKKAIGDRPGQTLWDPPEFYSDRQWIWSTAAAIRAYPVYTADAAAWGFSVPIKSETERTRWRLRYSMIPRLIFGQMSGS